MISSGASIKAVQRQLGHGSAAMTLDLYGHLHDDDLEALADALDQRYSPDHATPARRRADSGVIELRPESAASLDAQGLDQKQ